MLRSPVLNDYGVEIHVYVAWRVVAHVASPCSCYIMSCEPVGPWDVHNGECLGSLMIAMVRYFLQMFLILNILVGICLYLFAKMTHSLLVIWEQ